MAVTAAAALSAAEKFDLQKKTEAAQKGDAEAQNEIGEYYADGGGGGLRPELRTRRYVVGNRRKKRQHQGAHKPRGGAIRRATGCSPTCREP